MRRIYKVRSLTEERLIPIPHFYSRAWVERIILRNFIIENWSPSSSIIVDFKEHRTW